MHADQQNLLLREVAADVLQLLLDVLVVVEVVAHFKKHDCDLVIVQNEIRLATQIFMQQRVFFREVAVCNGHPPHHRILILKRVDQHDFVLLVMVSELPIFV